MDRSVIRALESVQWDFANVKEFFRVHGIHSYPARFPPALPRTLISLLSEPGDVVLDPFCGCGTTLVEALALGRSAVGVDANPIAWLIASAKINRLGEDEYTSLFDLANRVRAIGHGFRQLCLSSDPDCSEDWEDEAGERVLHPDIREWFDSLVIEELEQILRMIDCLPTETSRIVAKCAFSSILINVSYQDSDTRYVRRNKLIRPGEVYQKFAARLRRSTEAIREFQATLSEGVAARVLLANVLEKPKVGPVDVVITSPPYPNAWSYHLYHRLRMLWLGFDCERFKMVEIGSHRKYSRNSKNRSRVGPETFEAEMKTVFQWLGSLMKRGGYACIVIGDSTINGRVVENDSLVARAAAGEGFRLLFQRRRGIDVAKKSFVPTIGKIASEHVMVFEFEG